MKPARRLGSTQLRSYLGRVAALLQRVATAKGELDEHEHADVLLAVRETVWLLEQRSVRPRVPLVKGAGHADVGPHSSEHRYHGST